MKTKKRTKSRRAITLHCWRRFCYWRKKSSKADAKARYWLRRYTDSQGP